MGLQPGRRTRAEERRKACFAAGGRRRVQGRYAVGVGHARRGPGGEQRSRARGGARLAREVKRRATRARARRRIGARAEQRGDGVGGIGGGALRLGWGMTATELATSAGPHGRSAACHWALRGSAARPECAVQPGA
jgi:hypothetical protein